MLLIVSMRDLRAECRDLDRAPTLADLPEVVQRAAVFMSTVVLHDPAARWGSDEVLLKTREHGA